MSTFKGNGLSLLYSMIDWLLLFAYYKAHRQQPIIETVQCDEEIADKVSKLRVLGYGTGCVNTMCAGVSTGVCHAPIVRQVSGTPPSRASRLRFATAWQARRYITVFPFDSIPMQTMCRKSTSVTEQTLYLLRIETDPCISSCPSSFSKLVSRFFILRKRKKKKRT